MMKNIILLAFALFTLRQAAFSNEPDNLNEQVLTVFNQTFPTATNVKWMVTGDCLNATSRSMDSKCLSIHKNSERIATTRNITPVQLLIGLFIELKRKYKHQWLTKLFEISAGGETAYYATLCSADLIPVLKSFAFDRRDILKKIRRNVKYLISFTFGGNK